MTYLLSILVLALAWVAVTGSFTFPNLLAGVALAFLVMLISRHRSSFPRKTWLLVVFIAAFLVELIRANFRVARDVLSPRPRIAPGVMAVHLNAVTDAEITVIANLISLTPGTLSLDVSDDRQFLYVHSMYLDDPEELQRSITEGVERRTLELLR